MCIRDRVNGDQRAWQALLRIAQIIEGFDAQARDVHAQRGAMAQERDRLQQHQLEIERLRTMRTVSYTHLSRVLSRYGMKAVPAPWQK